MESRAEIRDRILKLAAEYWQTGQRTLDVAAFDPLVRLLVEANATELERIAQDLENSRERILERLLELVTPDVLTGPQPAHGVLYARSIKPAYSLRQADQVYTSVKSGKNEKDVFFSPANGYRILDGSVRYLAVGNRIYGLDESAQRDTLITAGAGKQLPGNRIWLGLELSKEITSLSGFHFFINWKNFSGSDLAHYLELFQHGRWRSRDGALTVISGYGKDPRPIFHSIKSPLERDYHPTLRIEEKVEQFYQGHFFKVVDSIHGNETKSLHDQKEFYPPEFASAFTHEKFGAIFKDQSIWISIELPDFFPTKILQDVECYLNCFPVINRRILEVSSRLKEQINIIPLKSDEYFFDIERVASNQDIEYQAMPLGNIRGYEAGSFILRKKGLGRYDEHQAARSIQLLLDQLRDESASFAAFNLDTMAANIRDLNQKIAALEQLMINTSQKGALTYIIVKPLSGNEQIRATYWSTNGEEGNRIPSGKGLEVHRFTSVRPNTIRLVKTTSGGRNPLMPQESAYAYKKALISRERVVTPEDVKAFCWAELGDLLQEVEIHKGFRISNQPHHGIERTVEVHLLMKTGLDKKNEELEAYAQGLEKSLNQAATGILPIVVKVKTPENA